MIKPSPTSYGLKAAQPRMQKFKKSAVYIIRKIQDGFEAGIAEENTDPVAYVRNYADKKPKKTPLQKESRQKFKTYEEAEKFLAILRESGL